MRPCAAEDLLRGLVDVDLVADIERDRLGLAAGLGDLRDHRVERILAAAGDHHRPAVRRQKLRPDSPIPLPPPVTQATRFPLFDMQTVSVAL